MSTATRIPDPLDTSKLRTLDVDGVRVRYYEDGQGPPLVIFGGGEFGSLDGLDRWSFNLPGLAKDFHVLCVDKLGQGHTDNPPRDEDYNFGYLVKHTVNFLKKLGMGQKVTLVGQSRGGLLVTRVTLEYPELVERLVIVDSATLAPESPQFPSTRWYQNIGGALSPTGEPALASVRIELDAQAYDRAHVTDEYLERMLEIATQPKFRGRQKAMARVRESVWVPSLEHYRKDTVRRIEDHGIPAPTLLIWGLNDQSAPLLQGVRLLEAISWKTGQVEMHVLNGAGHYSYREQPEAFNRALKSFCFNKP